VRVTVQLYMLYFRFEIGESNICLPKCYMYIQMNKNSERTISGTSTQVKCFKLRIAALRHADTPMLGCMYERMWRIELVFPAFPKVCSSTVFVSMCFRERVSYSVIDRFRLGCTIAMDLAEYITCIVRKQTVYIFQENITYDILVINIIDTFYLSLKQVFGGWKRFRFTYQDQFKVQ